MAKSRTWVLTSAAHIPKSRTWLSTNEWMKKHQSNFENWRQDEWAVSRLEKPQKAYLCAIGGRGGWFEPWKSREIQEFKFKTCLQRLAKGLAKEQLGPLAPPSYQQISVGNFALWRSHQRGPGCRVSGTAKAGTKLYPERRGSKWKSKNLPAMQKTWVWSLGWKDPLEKGMTTLSSIFLPGEFHGWRSLAGCSPWYHKESDTTEWLTLHFHSTCYQPTLHSSASRMLTARVIFLRHEIIGFFFGETV